MKKNIKITIGIILVLIIIGTGTFIYNSDYTTKISLHKKLKILNEYECISIPCEDSPVITLTKKEQELRNKELGIKTKEEEYISEEERIKIDEYNFEQLEKVKTILDGLDKNSYSFSNLKEFNKEFNQDITPIKNCYFISNIDLYFEKEKGEGGYMFGFELYSKKYRKIYKNIYRGEYVDKVKKSYNKSTYGENYYFFPLYNIPYIPFCSGGKICDDLNFIKIEEIITNPCKD